MWLLHAAEAKVSRRAALVAMTRAAVVVRFLVDEALRRYRDDPNAQLLVAMHANETVGLAGYRVAADAAEIELLHVATASHVRRRGVGRRLLAEVRRDAPPGLPLVAETDDAAVPFYSAAGFTVTSLGEKYPGVQRYRVKLRGAEGPDPRDSQ